MVWELILGFVVLVAASYVGTTMALRGFFGRERYESPSKGDDGGTGSTDDAPGGDAERRDDGVSWADDVVDDADESD